MNKITGISLLILLLSFIAPKGHAFTAFCSHVYERDAGWASEANHRLVYSKISLDCFFKQKGKGNWGGSEVTLSTFGPGLQMDAIEGITINCPLVSQKRLDKVITKKGSWNAVGLGASANFLIGGRAGIAVNHRGAVCVLAGVSALNLGAAAGAIQIKVHESPLENQVQFQHR